VIRSLERESSDQACFCLRSLSVNVRLSLAIERLESCACPLVGVHLLFPAHLSHLLGWRVICLAVCHMSISYTSTQLSNCNPLQPMPDTHLPRPLQSSLSLSALAAASPKPSLIGSMQSRRRLENNTAPLPWQAISVSFSKEAN